MSIQSDIKKIVENIFESEGLKEDFFSNEYVEELIRDNYLSEEFREFNEFKTEKESNILGGEDEKVRRRQWTGYYETRALSSYAGKSKTEFQID